jgi:hypothetical protein
MNKKELEIKRKRLDSMIDVQMLDGNWNYSSYMHGLLNGMLLARVTIFGGDYKPMSAPKKWKRKSWLRRIIDRFVNKPLEEE